ncbi:uncharacterized protein LOC133740732 [Rosa rugosa]|uniref:uncharacterized protein LOC133740732 n=1 Tax=Rosa rugosa TaxID=74645 RepID=UPI002B40EC79|nr:uncharacterized protein LOC133740732 [Rosa rugosa]
MPSTFDEMPSLSSGVLEKLVEEMGSDPKALNGDRKPVLLQIRSIMPVLAEGDLWPNKGFYLKVSDAAHTMYVSLPPEQDDMVLCNTLQLGQLIYVEKLEVARPVPVLRGINPVPGQLIPCVGQLEDLVSIDKFVDFKGASDLLFVMEKNSNVGKKPQSKFRSLRASKARPSEKISRICRSGSGDVVDKEICEVTKGSRKVSSRYVESDSESTTSSSSLTQTARRRSWIGPEAADFPLVKHEIKPSARRSRSAHVSPVRSTRNGSDDNSSCKIKRTISFDQARKSSKNSNNKISVYAKNCEQPLDPPVTVNLAIDSNWSESNIQWNSLPPTLVTLGKEVLRHKDVSLLAAVEALQETSVAERLLKCLSTYSELQLAEGEEHLPSIIKFFDLQDYLVHTRLIVQSLTNISPLRDDDTNLGSPGSIKEALILAVDRKKNATSWIKAAMSSDLSPSFSLDSVPMKATNSSNKSSKTCGNVPKGTLIVKKQKNDAHIGLVSERENLHDWVKGSALSAAADLEKSLHDECRKWFLATFESYLDEVKSRTDFMESDSQVAETMCQIKKVGDRLDVIVSKEDSELEAYGRIKEKIYGVLLKNVERTTMVMEQMNAIFNVDNGQQ